MKIKNILFTSLLFSVFSCNVETTDTSGNSNFSVRVIVDYGDSKESQEEDITSQRQLTALEALQYASVVETYPAGKYIFVSSIDSVRAIRGLKAWYYKVNGKSPRVVANHNIINNGDTIHWIYKNDVCSHTVDKK